MNAATHSVNLTSILRGMGSQVAHMKYLMCARTAAIQTMRKHLNVTHADRWYQSARRTLSTAMMTVLDGYATNVMRRNKLGT